MDPLPPILDELSAYSVQLGDEAVHYWQCHLPRLVHLAREIGDLQRERPLRRVLDLGMGFQTLLLRRLLPEAVIECAGVGEDARFRPAGAYRFHELDLNGVSRAPEQPAAPAGAGDYDLIVFMEVLEHLYTPPALVLRDLATRLAPGGFLFVTTPNAAWLKNRLKLLRGRNPFELLRPDPRDMGHIREYTRAELEAAIAAAGLVTRRFDRRGLYHFSGAKDRFYSALADLLHPSLSRSMAAVCTKA